MASSPRRMELPVYFSLSQAEYFFDFAETRIPSKPGEEIVLLKGKVNIQKLSDAYDLLSTIAKNEELQDWEVVCRKRASDPKSGTYRSKVVEDLNVTRDCIQKSRRQAMLKACN
ncbi:MAG: hypothetical protein ACRBB6_00760 [Neptuniibacter sp.]